MSLMNPDYQKFYANYRKLPGILTILIAVLSLAWSIVDVCVFYDSSYSRYSGYEYYYGVMQLPSIFLALLIWWAIGAVLCFIVWYISCLSVSATIARTDAVLKINEKLSNQD